MVSMSAVALGISFLTTSLLTAHDTAKQVEHARGFATFLLTQDIQSNAQYALTCVTTAIEERVATRGEEIRKNIFNASSDFLNQSLSNIQAEIDRKLKSLSIRSLVNLVREEEQKFNQDKITKMLQENELQQKLSDGFKGSPSAEPLGLFHRLSELKHLISRQISKELDIYQSIRRAKQKEALFYLYDIYKQSQGIKNNKWITPYNVIMMVLLGIGSFFVPKIVIGIAISYFLASELYLLSDTLASATQSQMFEGLNFDRIFEFHLMVLATGLGLNRYHIFREKEDSISGSRYQRLSASY